MKKNIGVIPARYASTRFPGKPLVEIKGKSMIQRVYEQASKVKRLSEVIVATDDEKIFKHVKDFGGKVVMTSPDHDSGTSRCAEVIKKLTEEVGVVINIQGDEPFIDPAQIESLLDLFENENTEIGTLIKKIEDNTTLFNPNVPKVVINHENNALYFSRSTIPFLRGEMEGHWLEKNTFYKHIGIYSYRADVLLKLVELDSCVLEEVEKLEQLRWLYNGYTIKTAITTIETVGIDTEEDLKELERFFDKK